jgi:hypothetical protein
MRNVYCVTSEMIYVNGDPGKRHHFLFGGASLRASSEQHLILIDCFFLFHIVNQQAFCQNGEYYIIFLWKYNLITSKVISGVFCEQVFGDVA